jgi:hypothetical protein
MSDADADADADARPVDATPADARTAADWIAAYATRLGLDAPDPAEIDTLLTLAGVAAHASQRQAAPISTWLAARAGLSPEQALAAAQDLAAELG